MEGSLEAPPPTPATPSATVDPSPHRSPDPSSDAAAGASVPPTPQHPARLFATPSDYFATFGPVATFGFLLADPIVPPAFSFDLIEGFPPLRPAMSRARGPACAHCASQSTDNRTCDMRFARILCLNLSFSLLGAYRTSLSLYGGPFSVWRAL